MTNEHDSAAAAPISKGPSMIRRIQIGLGLAALSAVLVLVWEWRSPEAFSLDGAMGYANDDWPVGAPLYVGVTWEPKASGVTGSIDIHDVDADVTLNTAGARIEYFLCTVDVTSGVGAIGSEREESIRKSCSTLVPAAGTTMELNGDPRQQVVLAVTATQPGTVQIAGTDLSYSYGWRTGSQRLAVELELTAVDESRS